MKKSNTDLKRWGNGKQSFLHGALILTISIFIVKIIGMFFKVPLNWIIKEDGMGYFGTAYNFYGPVYSLAAAGFPIAISKTVSEDFAKGNFKDVRQVHKASVPLFLITGCIGTLVMILGAKPYSVLIKNPYSYFAILALSPAILSSCLSSVYRGYYEGLKNMYPTAISGITEALGKLFFGLSGAYAVMHFGGKAVKDGCLFGKKIFETQANGFDVSAILFPFAAAAAVFGVTLGSFLSFLYLFFYHKRNGDIISLKELEHSPAPRSPKDTAIVLIKTAVPIGIGAVAVNIASLIDTTFLQTRISYILAISPRSLLEMYKGQIPQKNLYAPDTIPNFLFGCYTNALTLYMLIPSVTQAIGISALPNVTAAWTSGIKSEIKKSIETVFKITAVFSIPAGIGMSVMALPVARLVYGEREAVGITGLVLSVMGIAAVFASISTPLNSMLQAVGRVDLPVKILCIGLVLKISCTYIISGIPEINIMGAGIGTAICYSFSAVSAVIMLCRITGIIPDFRDILLKPFAASLICVMFAYSFYHLAGCYFQINEKIITLLSLLGACIIYIFTLFILNVIKRNEFKSLYKRKIKKTLEKHREIG